MRKFFTLVLAVVLLASLSTMAQTSTAAADAAAIAVTRGESTYAGGMITIVARHCDQHYSAVAAKFGKPWASLSHQQQAEGVEACNADPATEYFRDKGHNTAINAGISLRQYLLSSTAPSSAGPAAYLALTSDTTVPGATQCAYITTSGAITSADCALGTGEYTTVGLGRALATFTAGSTNTYTLDHTWTCSSCSSSVVAAVGVFDRAYGTPKGVLVWWYKFGSSVTLNGSDQIQVTDTITVS